MDKVKIGFPIENLRGILTRNQMEQMAYKVGE